jgi:OOP family OmpA-OmpF porin
MRRLVASLIAVAFATSGAAVLTGCSASARIGSTPEKKKKEPPPPPPKKEEKKEEAKPKKKKTMKIFKMKGDELELPGPVVYETGSDVIRPESEPVLQIVHDYMEQEDDITMLRIEGHTDGDGPDNANMDLSKRRAMSVSRWLTGKGISCKRLMPVGFGETKPIADNKSEDGKAQNRRTAFVNAARKGKPVGGKPVDGGGQTAGDPCQ